MTPSYMLPPRSGPRREMAQRAAYSAMLAGKIERKSACVVCLCAPPRKGGRSGLVMHHPDYDQPLFVVSLCGPCHRKVHTGRLREPVTGRMYPPPIEQRRLSKLAAWSRIAFVYTSRAHARDNVRMLTCAEREARIVDLDDGTFRIETRGRLGHETTAGAVTP